MEAGDAAASGAERYGYAEEARRAEEAAGLPPALQDPTALPAVPPGVVTPLYAFEPLSDSAKDRLWLHVRLATPHGRWSPAISLSDEERSFFFTESSGGDSLAQAESTVLQVVHTSAVHTVVVAWATHDCSSDISTLLVQYTRGL